MSTSSWKKKYYRVTAAKLAASDASDLKLIEHALKKWQGLFKTNLSAHDLEHHRGNIYFKGDLTFEIDFRSCALCVRYIDDSCHRCPLSVARNNVSCDRSATGESRAPFSDMVIYNDPRPMIKQLKKAKRVLLEDTPKTKV